MASNEKAGPLDEAANKPDLLHGVQAIADHLGLNFRRAYHMIEKGGLPVFKIAGRVCARRSTINQWLADCEAKAMEGR